MKKTTIKFKGNEYSIETGEVFLAKVKNGIPGTIFVSQTNPNEKVYLELLEKLSSDISLLRVNEIQWEEDNQSFIENFNNVILGGEEKVISIEDMTKKELINFIRMNNLDINTKLKKTELLEAIKDSFNK